jgi:iodotyrosine deiodinase
MPQETRFIDGYPFISYTREFYPPEEMIRRSTDFYQWLDKRRTVRDFSDKPIPLEVIENIIKSASTSPSGAHKQPWSFCVVSDPELKREIRTAAEKEERESYESRMSEEWLDDIKALQTDWQKPFIEIAPYLIVVFKNAYELNPDGSKRNNYYVTESVGLACGFLLAAIHHAGLVALTHTPSPMNFITTILKRPANERPFLIIPVGYPHPETYVPKLERKSLDEVMTLY